MGLDRESAGTIAALDGIAQPLRCNDALRLQPLRGFSDCTLKNVWSPMVATW